MQAQKRRVKRGTLDQFAHANSPFSVTVTLGNGKFLVALYAHMYRTIEIFRYLALPLPRFTSSQKPAATALFVLWAACLPLAPPRCLISLSITFITNVT
jgi:hypothetical protein